MDEAVDVQQQQLEFRLATPADKAQVLNCHGDEPGSIYNGMDYLPVRYDRTLGSSNKVGGLCFHRSAGLVVAYGQIFVFDNNRHMLLTALRVHPQYQGRGIATNLRNFICRETLKRFPNVEHEVRIGVYKQEFSSADFYARNPDYEFLSKRHYYLMEFALSQLPQLQQTMSRSAAAVADSSAQAQWTDRRQLFASMLSNPAFRRMYSDVVVSINFEILELLETNLDVLPGDGDEALSARVVSGNDVTLAFGSITYCLRGLRADIDLYSNSVDSDRFSPDALAEVSAGIVVQCLHRVLSSQFDQLSRMPAKSLSVFVSLDCFNRSGFGCPDCHLESRLAARLRSVIGDDVIHRHPYYNEASPYAMLKRRVQL